MLSLSHESQADVFILFSSSIQYLDDILILIMISLSKQ